jgi:hypothetical protein
LTSFLLILQLCCVDAIRLHPIQAGVKAVSGQQFGVMADFNDVAPVEDNDAIGVFNGGQAMGDDEGGATLTEDIQRLLDLAFGLSVQR